MNTLLNNLRFTWRQMRKSPGFAITAILTLALGIGATTAIYTVVYATLIAPMPYPKPDQLVMVWSQFGNSVHNSVAGADYLDWKQQNTVFRDSRCLLCYPIQHGGQGRTGDGRRAICRPACTT